MSDLGLVHVTGAKPWAMVWEPRCRRAKRVAAGTIPTRGAVEGRKRLIADDADDADFFFIGYAGAEFSKPTQTVAGVKPHLVTVRHNTRLCRTCVPGLSPLLPPPVRRAKVRACDDTLVAIIASASVRYGPNDTPAGKPFTIHAVLNDQSGQILLCASASPR
jgi:hypothetical protein